MEMEPSQKTILIAPLNWGLGHAARCIPLIKALQKNNFIPIIASDGAALELLRKEFPYIKTLELPSYQIEYAKNGRNFRSKLLKNLPKMIRAISKEKRMTEEWIDKYEIDGIISDNRLGVFSKKKPSVFITHQLNVMTGNTTWLTSKIHQNIIKKHDACWVPDVADAPNLSGELGHLKSTDLKLNYIGPLSRIQKKEVEKKYDLMVILSGPEPQRSYLEDKLKTEVMKYDGKVIFVKGLIEKEQQKQEIGHITFYNYMNSRQLEQCFNESELVLCRSGYTTIMDLAKLEKKAFFIPTPGQYEQEYLAQKLQKNGLVPYASQDDFTIEKLSEVAAYTGLKQFSYNPHWESLFNIFEQG